MSPWFLLYSPCFALSCDIFSVCWSFPPLYHKPQRTYFEFYIWLVLSPMTNATLNQQPKSAKCTVYRKCKWEIKQSENTKCSLHMWSNCFTECKLPVMVLQVKLTSAPLFKSALFSHVSFRVEYMYVRSPPKTLWHRMKKMWGEGGASGNHICHDKWEF